MEDEKKVVVIATTEVDKALYFIARNAVAFDYLELQYVEKFSPTVEYLLRILRKGFGWMEIDRGVKFVKNNRCRFNKGGFCTNPIIGKNIRCTEPVRSNCKEYTPRFNSDIRVNYVNLEKAGQIRGM